MNFFKIKTTWANAEFIPFKICIASIYVIIGSFFHEYIRPYYSVLFIVFGVTAIWTYYLWITKMKNNHKNETD